MHGWNLIEITIRNLVPVIFNLVEFAIRNLNLVLIYFRNLTKSTVLFAFVIT